MELKRLGHDVTIIASSFDHLTRQEARPGPGQTSTLQVIQGIKFLWLRTPPCPANTARRVWNMAVFAWRLWRRCGMTERARADVIVGSSPQLFVFRLIGDGPSKPALSRRVERDGLNGLVCLEWPVPKDGVGDMVPLARRFEARLLAAVGADDAVDVVRTQLLPPRSRCLIRRRTVKLDDCTDRR